jgi:hypothetical protein
MNDYRHKIQLWILGVKRDSHEFVDYVINKWWSYKWKHKIIISLNVFHPYDIHEGEQNGVDF